LSTLWTTATEERLRLGALQGKIQVLAMLYTSCEYACPILISILQNIAAALEPEVRNQVGFVLVTFDPEHDTPAVLRAYSTRMALHPAQWTLLRGDPEDTLELAVLLGVKYRKNPQGGFAHSNLITVLNSQGEIVHRHIGLQQSVADTLVVIRRLVHE
jgi:protein SCO1/2